MFGNLHTGLRGKMSKTGTSSTFGQLCKDRALGKKQGEMPVKEFIKAEFGISVKIIDEKKIGYDLQLSYKKDKTSKFAKKYGRTFEVKRDFTSDRTGNFFFEAWSNKAVNNSGCMFTCAANTLVIVQKKTFIFLDRPRLLAWVMDNLYFDSDLAKAWKKLSSKGKKLKFQAVRKNSEALGILIPIQDLKGSSACIETFVRE
jgi:hypothetical protein